MPQSVFFDETSAFFGIRFAAFLITLHEFGIGVKRLPFSSVSAYRSFIGHIVSHHLLCRHVLDCLVVKGDVIHNYMNSSVNKMLLSMMQVVYIVTQ